MKTFTYIALTLTLALLGMASAFFKPAQPVQAPNNAVAMNAELFGLDNPGMLKSEEIRWRTFYRFLKTRILTCLPSIYPLKQESKRIPTLVLLANVASVWDEPDRQTALSAAFKVAGSFVA